MSAARDTITPVGSEDSIEANRRETWMTYFRASAAKHGIPLSWLLAIARKETHFCNLRSPAGASDDALGGSWGPCQCSAALAHDLGVLPRDQGGEWLLHDVARGIDAGATALAHIRDRLIARGHSASFSDVAVGYNAGVGNVLKGFKDLPYVTPAAEWQQEYACLDTPTAEPAA